MAPKKGARGKFAKPIKTQIKRTHFVCFPLTTEESISQLKDSLARFRQVTSILEDAAQDSSSSTQWQRSQRENHQSAPGLPEPPSDSSTKDLRQIPSAAYRPPGTFHLTLGVMDLSAHEDMERAIHLLEDINYTDLLRGAETTTTAAPGQQGQDVKTTPRGLSSRHLNVGIAETTPWSSEGGAPSTSGGEGKQPMMAAPNTIQKPLESLSRPISPPPPSAVSNPSKTTTTTTTTTTPRLNDPPSPSHHHLLPLQPLTLTLQGLGTFPSARSSRVFFAHAHDPSRRLQLFAERVRQRFQDAGLITETRPLVLHATMANLIYVKGSGGGGGKKGRWNFTSSGGNKAAGEVDAREILKFFNGGSGEDLHGDEGTGVDGMSDSHGGYIWARDVKVNSVRICKMGAEPCDVPDWGLEYKPIAERVIPP